MDLNFWKELAITQTTTAAISLTASTVLAVFVAASGSMVPVTRKTVLRKGKGDGSKVSGQVRQRLLGLSSPYRRIIFGLSVSDMMLSIGLLAGPWLSVEGTPFAHWAKGNIHTCRFGGLIGAIGLSAVPMYTLFLCVYYVSKLKWKMTDEAFANKIEKKTHAAIFLLNSAIYFTALGLDLFNTSTFGTVCYIARRPAGCQFAPETFGECETPMAERVMFFTAFNAVISPLICLAGCVGCICIIILHTIVRDRIFGRSKTSSPASSKYAHTTSKRERNVAAFSIGSDITKFHARSSQSTNGDKSGSYKQVVGGDSVVMTIGGSTSEHNQEICVPEQDEVINDDSPSLTLATLPTLLSNKGTGKGQAERMDYGGSCHSPFKPTNPSEDKLAQLDEENVADTDNYSQERPLRQKSTRDSVELYRVYKRELVVQAFCYVINFCLSALPFMIVALHLVLNKPLPRALSRFLVIFFPLGGLFNILVFTRPNVASLRRMYPELSWLRAFWLVLRTGGDLPDNISAAKTCCCLDRVNSHKGRKRQGDEVEAPESNTPVSHASGSAKSLAYGWENQLDSKLCINGLSKTFEKSNLAYNSKDWSYAKGGAGSMLNAVEEIDGDSLRSFSDICNNESSISPVQRELDSMEEIWAEAFDRVRNYRVRYYRPSM